MCEAELHQRIIFFKKLREVHIFPAFITLLIKINGPDTILIILDIRSNIYYKIVAAHITQQTHKASLIELYKLLRQPVKISP